MTTNANRPPDSAPAAAAVPPAAPPPAALWLGLALSMGGAMLLANKGILAKLLYAEGVDVTTLVAVRSAAALPVFWVWAGLRLGWGRIVMRDRRGIAISAAAGLACYYVGALVNFESLRLIDASLERVLLYAYPSFVVLAEAIRRGRLPPGRTLLALAITYLGIVLAVGALDADLFDSNAYGAALALASAVGFTFYFLANQAAAARIGSVRFTVFAMTAATAGLLAHFLALRPPLEELAAFTSTAWGLMALLVGAVTVLPLFMIAEGVRQLGAERAALVSTIGPPTTIVMAWIVLGEVLAPMQLLGAAAVITGILVLEGRGLRGIRWKRKGEGAR